MSCIWHMTHKKWPHYYLKWSCGSQFLARMCTVSAAGLLGEKVPLNKWGETGHLCPELVASLPARPWASSCPHHSLIDFTSGASASLLCSRSFGGNNCSHCSAPQTERFSSFPKLCSPTCLPLDVPLSHQKLRDHDGSVSPEEVMGPAWEIPALFQPVFWGKFQSDRTFKEAIENQARLQGEGTGTKHSCSFSPWAVKTETLCSCSSG